MDELYAELGYHEAKVISFELKGPNAMELSAKFMADFRANVPTELCGAPVIEVTDYQTRICRDLVNGTEAPVLLPKSNVVTLSLGDKGSVIVRPSGTEPKVKLYLTAVDHDKAQANALLDALSARMCEFLPKNA